VPSKKERQLAKLQASYCQNQPKITRLEVDLVEDQGTVLFVATDLHAESLPKDDPFVTYDISDLESLRWQGKTVRRMLQRGDTVVLHHNSVPFLEMIVRSVMASEQVGSRIQYIVECEIIWAHPTKIPEDLRYEWLIK
jgi:hypothetical protein